MKPFELLRRLRRRANRLGIEHNERPAKGGHVLVRHGGRIATVPMHRHDLPVGTWHGIQRQLGIAEHELED
jgi:predicted RNA binding protein YcfA (HicA-like mRNA interferase family)